jgi:hypothetical protein
MKMITSLPKLWLFLVFVLSAEFAWSLSFNLNDTVPDENASIRLTPFTELDTIPEFDPICIPDWTIERSSVVRYTTYARVYFRFYGTGNETIAFLRETGSSEVGLSIDPTDSHDQYLTLPLEQKFEVRSLNDCGDTVIVSRISTITEYPEVLELEERFFFPLHRWASYESNAPTLYEFIRDSIEATAHEKTSVLQNFFGTATIPTAMQGVLPPQNVFSARLKAPGTPPPPPPPGPTPTDDPNQSEGGGEGSQDDGCQCRVMKLAFSLDVSPEDPRTPSTFLTPKEDFGEREFGSHWLHGKDEGKIKWHFRAAGPSRYMWLDGRTFYCHNTPQSQEWAEFDPETGPNGNGYPVYRSEITFGQACYDGNWRPSSNCQCVNEISVAWDYLSRHTVKAHFQDGNFCLNNDGRGATATTDEFAFLAVYGERDDEIEILDFLRLSAVQECQRDFDEGKLISMLEVAGWIAGSVATQGKALALTPEVLDDINNLIAEPWVIFKGECGQKDWQNGVFNQEIIKLNGSQLKKVILGASSYMNIRGDTHWEATTRIVSSFRLSAILLQQFSTPEHTYCCTRSFGAYTLKNVNSSGSESIFIGQLFIFELQNDVGGHFNHPRANFSGILPFDPVSGNYEITNERNMIDGNPVPDCQTRINERSYRLGPTTKLDNESGNFITLVDQTAFLIRQKGFETPVPFKVFDISGKLIKQGTGTGSEIPVLDRTINPTGVYMIHVLSQPTQQVFKYFLP